MSNVSKFTLLAIGFGMGIMISLMYVKKLEASSPEIVEKDIPEEDASEDVEDVKDEPDFNEYTKTVQKYDYSSYSTDTQDSGYRPFEDKFAELEGKADLEKKPEYYNDYADIIPPENFGELDDYETSSLTYYSGDDVLADENNEIVSYQDREKLIGREALNHFGEYEEDSVFVRNDILGCDFEILLDHGKYSDVLEKMPWIRNAHIHNGGIDDTERVE